MKLDAFPMELLKGRVEYEMERGIWPSFGRHLVENIFSRETGGKQRRKQSLALRIRIMFYRLFFTHTTSIAAAIVQGNHSPLSWCPRMKLRFFKEH